MPTTPHPITKEKVPLTMGHEISGTVDEIGEDIHDLKVGSRVVIQPIIYDGTCNACREGYINCCDNNGFIGLSGKGISDVHNDLRISTNLPIGWGGGLSEYLTVPQKAVYQVPDSIPMDIAGKALSPSLGSANA